MAKKVFNRLISIYLAVCFAVVCMFGFVGCGNIDVEGDGGNAGGGTAETYYAYDAESGEYDDGNYITLDGTAATWHGVDVVLGEKDFIGSVFYSGDEFSVAVNGEFSAADKCMVTYRGAKEGDGVLRVDSTVITRYSSLVDPTTTTDTTVRYYCKKDSKPTDPVLPNETDESDNQTDGTYYLYDADAEEYVESKYIVITGRGCKLITESDGMTVTLTGTFTKTDDQFVVDCSLTLFGSMTMRTVYKGKIEKSGVLHITSSKNIDDDGATDTSVYYCKKGVKPDAPVVEQPKVYKVSIHSNGGSYANSPGSPLTTDENGRIVLPSEKPTRPGGYVFNGYNTKMDGTGEAVDNTTVFTQDCFIYAVWAKEVTVTFMDGMAVFKTKKVGKGMPLGDFDIATETDWRNFKGWYLGNKQYVSFTVVDGDTTLTAKYYTDSENNEYANALRRLPSFDKIYIHYRRKDHIADFENDRTASDYNYNLVYGNWKLWAWPNGSNGRFFQAEDIDMFGAVYVIDCSEPYSDCGWDGANRVPLDKISQFTFETIGVKFVDYSSVLNPNTSFWKSDGGDIMLPFDDYVTGNHVFFWEGQTRFFSYERF